ncbi:MAG: hypothetical protein AAGJ55_12495, partial [Cyanobacteria bacterium J06555_12]
MVCIRLNKTSLVLHVLAGKELRSTTPPESRLQTSPTGLAADSSGHLNGRQQLGIAVSVVGLLN